MAGSPRHGHGGFSQLPVPLGQGQRGPTSTGGVVAPAAARPTSGALPMQGKAVSDFLAAFPDPNIQQLALCDSLVYPPGTVREDILEVTGATVPEGMVYVFTDIYFFALAPGGVLMGAAQRLPAGALAGLLRFSLEFNERGPAQLEGVFVSPRAGTFRDIGRRSGWPWIDREFGVQRGLAWALYAREQVQYRATAVVDVVPDFPITTVGVELHGFSLTAKSFSDVFPGI